MRALADGFARFTDFTNSEFVNNIIRGSGSEVVFIDYASTNTTNVWKHNILVNQSGGGSQTGPMSSPV